MIRYTLSIVCDAQGCITELKGTESYSSTHQGEAVIHSAALKLGWRTPGPHQAKRYKCPKCSRKGAKE